MFFHLSFDRSWRVLSTKVKKPSSIGITLYVNKSLSIIIIMIIIIIAKYTTFELLIHVLLLAVVVIIIITIVIIKHFSSLITSRQSFACGLIKAFLILTYYFKLSLYLSKPQLPGKFKVMQVDLNS